MKVENNFDLLRFAFAFVVFLVHAQTLSGNAVLAPLAKWLSSEMAIQGFFVISGYLVYMSYENSRTLLLYLGKRTRRIYPAYLAAILFGTTLGMGLTSHSLADYFSGNLAKYLAANLMFLNFLAPNLPGVFESNPVQAVNGALWTLKIEVMFYLSVPLIAWAARRFGHMQVLMLLYAGSLAYSLGMTYLHAATGIALFDILARQLPGQLGYFVTGIALYHWRQSLPQPHVCLLVSLLLLWLVDNPLVRMAISPAALGFIVIYFAIMLRPLGNFGRYGDLSYGVYIFHFPILQSLIALGLFPAENLDGLLIATILVLSAAFISWHVIEKRWLRKSSHYLVATSGS